MAVKQETHDAPLPTPPAATESRNKSREEEEEEEGQRQKARKDAMKRHTEIRRAFAWPLHRVPLEKHLASRYIIKGKAKLVLPRNYRASEGEDRKLVSADEDLNNMVFRWYDERVEAKQGDESNGVNFVAKDGVVARRHEYLGPDPRVAGYQLSPDGEIFIRWWDGFLEDQWVGKERWHIEVSCDEKGEWVENI